MARPSGRAPAFGAVRRAVAAALDELPDPAPDPPAVVVACSGGPDSLALAAGAVAAAGRRGTAVHGVVVDHGLQDGSARVAADAVAALEGLGLAGARVVPAAVPDGPGHGGPEAAARRARYAALAGTRPPGAPVLLGHTRDDQAETVLLGLARGSGARSLAGMRRWSPPWCRPLLDVPRATTRAACTELGLDPWADPHNHDPRFVRSRLRHEALPALEDALGGGVAAALARTAAQLADDDEALSAVAARRAAAVADPDGSLDARALAADPPAVRRRVLRDWLAAAGTGADDAQLRAVDELVSAWRGQGGPRLPGTLEVVRTHGRLRIHSPPTAP